MEDYWAGWDVSESARQMCNPMLFFISLCPLTSFSIGFHRTENDSEEEAEEEIPLLSEEEMNKLGSKLIKAEIMGNTVSFKMFY